MATFHSCLSFLLLWSFASQNRTLSKILKNQQFQHILDKEVAAGVYFTSLYSLIQGATTNF